jgi:hypothetical protein
MKSIMHFDGVMSIKASGMNLKMMYKPNADDIEQAVFDGLPLLHEKGILFVEAYIGD